ncbi:hypothetical protein T10_1673 [Trichinella papuae]|uniref:Uncharacterized protein n=1 Tax=Trichinella papuae TaxID=268474 RepID=A0A0V1MHF9_9BILA|nr:hypothetical protein T10_1673 [Trichinella papuae]
MAFQQIGMHSSNTVSLQHSRYVRSGGTVNVEFPRIVSASVNTPHRCFIILRNCPKAAGNMTDRLSKSLPEVDGLSGASFLKNIVTIHESGYSAFPDISGLVDQSGPSVWNHGTGAAVDQPPVCSASFPFALMFLSFPT